MHGCEQSQTHWQQRRQFEEDPPLSSLKRPPLDDGARHPPNSNAMVTASGRSTPVGGGKRDSMSAPATANGTSVKVGAFVALCASPPSSSEERRRWPCVDECTDPPLFLRVPIVRFCCAQSSVSVHRLDRTMPRTSLSGSSAPSSRRSTRRPSPSTARPHSTPPPVAPLQPSPPPRVQPQPGQRTSSPLTASSGRTKARRTSTPRPNRSSRPSSRA